MYRRFVKPVPQELLWQQVVPQNFAFFILGIGGKLYNFHAVEQGSGDGFQGVCRGKEHAVRKVQRDFHKVIAEGTVLLRVEHLKERGGGVTVRIACELIKLIQKNERVCHAALRYGAHNSARHGAHIGFAVPANIRLVADAAQRNAHEFSVHRLRNGGGNRALADARRAYKA